MPQTETRQLDDHTLLSFWTISETIPDLEKLFQELRPNQEIREFKSENRKKEWLASRILAYTLLGKFTSEPYIIVSDEHGKPCLPDTPFQVSISQSVDRVAVILSDRFEVGIDIEILREKILKVAFKFLSDREKDYTENDLAKTCLYWSAKETLYKMYSRKKLLFKENLPVGPMGEPEKGTLNGQVLLDNFCQNYAVHYEKNGDYILTYCIFNPAA